MAGVKKPSGEHPNGSPAQPAPGAQLQPAANNDGTRPLPIVDTYRMVDFVKAVAMRGDRGQEERVQRVRLGSSIEREDAMKVTSIVLNGAWFDITTNAAGVHTQGSYRVHVTNVISAERTG